MSYSTMTAFLIMTFFTLACNKKAFTQYNLKFYLYYQSTYLCYLRTYLCYLTYLCYKSFYLMYLPVLPEYLPLLQEFLPDVHMCYQSTYIPMLPEYLPVLLQFLPDLPRCYQSIYLVLPVLPEYLPGPTCITRLSTWTYLCYQSSSIPVNQSLQMTNAYNLIITMFQQNNCSVPISKKDHRFEKTLHFSKNLQNNLYHFCSSILFILKRMCYL